MKNLLRCILLCASVFPCVAGAKQLQASGQSFIVPPLSSATAGAERIAKIRVIRSEAVHVDITRDSAVCGYVLSAKVLGALKGGGTPFQFFVPNKADFVGPGDYFAFIYSHRALSEDQEVALRELATPQETAQALCLMRTTNYVPYLYQTLWAFDHTARWLKFPNRDDVLLCRDPSGRPRRERVAVVRDPRRVGAYSLVEWSDVKTLVERQLKSATPADDCGIVP
jgi:hypothetical protein